jgi:hypothetical protein
MSVVRRNGVVFHGRGLGVAVLSCAQDRDCRARTGIPFLGTSAWIPQDAAIRKVMKRLLWRNESSEQDGIAAHSPSPGLVPLQSLPDLMICPVSIQLTPIISRLDLIFRKRAKKFSDIQVFAENGDARSGGRHRGMLIQSPTRTTLLACL